MPISEEELQEIREQKAVDLVEDARDYGDPDDAEFDAEMDRYEGGLGWD